MFTYTEEHYLKALFRISFDNGAVGIGTNQLTRILGVNPASANDMLKKLREKGLVDYKDQKSGLTLIRLQTGYNDKLESCILIPM